MESLGVRWENEEEQEQVEKQQRCSELPLSRHLGYYLPDTSVKVAFVLELLQLFSTLIAFMAQ
jgi:hypothetical protein